MPCELGRASWAAAGSGGGEGCGLGWAVSEAGLSRESKLGRYAWAGKREVAMGRAELQGFGLVWTL